MPTMTNNGLFDLNSFQAPAQSQQPQPKKRGGVGGFLENVVHSAVSPFEYLLKASVVNPTKEIAAQLTNNKTALANATKGSNQNLGLGDKGTDFTGGLKKFIGNSAQALLTTAAPAVNSIKTGAAIGAGTGASSALTNRDSTLNDVVEGGLLGGVTGGGLAKVGKILNKTSSKDSGFMKNLTTQGQQAQGRVAGVSAGSKVGGKELTPQDTNQMLQTLKDEGIKIGNANNTLRDITDKLKGYGQQVSEHFKINSAPLKPEDTKVIADNFIKGLKTTDPAVLNQAEILVNDLQKNVKSTKDLWEFRKSLDSRIPDSKFMDDATTNKVAALKAMRQYVSDELGSVPGMKGYHDLAEVKPFISKEANRLNNPGGGIIGRVLSSGAAQKGESLLGKTAEKVGNIGGGEASASTVNPAVTGFLDRMTRQGATGMAGGSALPPQEPPVDNSLPIPETPANTTTEDALGFAGGTAGTGSNNPFDPASVESSVQSILSQGGTMKDVSEYLANVKAYQDLAGGSNKSKVGVVSSQNYANAQSGSQSIQALRQMLQENPSLLTKSAIPGGSLPIIGGYIKNASGTGQLDALAYNIADKYLKLTTGATATDAEIKNTATKLMPRAGDNSDTVNLKLHQLEDYYNTILGEASGQSGSKGTLQDLLANSGL